MHLALSCMRLADVRSTLDPARRYLVLNGVDLEMPKNLLSNVMSAIRRIGLGRWVVVTLTGVSDTVGYWCRRGGCIDSLRFDWRTQRRNAV